MEQFNPLFDQAKKFNKVSNAILWFSAILTSTGFIVKLYNIDLLYINDLISKINCFLILFYAILSFVIDFIFYNASIQEREHFIDNSFKTSFADKKFVNYYTNENIPNGIYKMAVNGFENVLFTYQISKKMLWGLWVKNILFAVLFLIFAVAGFNNAFILLIQLALPIILLQHAIKHTLFVNRIKRVYDNYKRLFNDLKNKKDYKHKRPEIIINVLDYETTLTYGSILLNTKTYNELNQSVSKQWKKIKQKYGI